MRSTTNFDMNGLEELLTPRQIRKLKRSAKRSGITPPHSNVVQLKTPKNNASKLVAKTKNQKKLISAINTSEQVITVGCAGTGKTYIPTIMAAQLLESKKIDKIVLSRPNVSAGKSLGFFPGTMEEKYGIWCVPFLSLLKEYFGESHFDLMMKRGIIEIVPFEVMRGRTFDNAFVILDEAENCTLHELKMFVTRIGEGTKVLINGDFKQADIPNSGLKDLIHIACANNIDVPVITFGPEDVVRSGICKQWIMAFEGEE